MWTPSFVASLSSKVTSAASIASQDEINLFDANLGLISRTLQLLRGGPPEPRGILHLLSLLSRHGESSARREVVREGKPILDAIKDHLGRDSDIVEFGVATLAHALESVLDRDFPTNLFEKLRMYLLLTVTVNVCLDPTVSHTVALHAIPIIMHGIRACPWQLVKKNVTPALVFVAALSRSDNISLRCAALFIYSGLYDLPPVSNRVPICTNPSLNLTSRRLPPDLRRAVEDYGIDRCEATLLEKCTKALTQGIQDLIMTGDLYTFGTTMAEHLLHSRYTRSTGDIAPHLQRSRSSYRSWEDCMRAAAGCLRARRDPRHLDMADVLDLETAVSGGTGDPEDGVVLAREVLKRNPRHAFAHMILCIHTNDPVEAVQTAQRGLDLSDLTPFIRRSILRCLMHTHASAAWNILLGASPADERLRIAGAAGVKIALQYAEAFIAEAPPDCSHLSQVLDEYIVHTFVLAGSGLSENLSELEVSLGFV